MRKWTFHEPRVLAKNEIYTDNGAMNIQSLSTDMAQGRVQEEAAVRVQSMAMQNIRNTGEDLTRIMDSAQTQTQVITDPARGNFLDLHM